MEQFSFSEGLGATGGSVDTEATGLAKLTYKEHILEVNAQNQWPIWGTMRVRVELGLAFSLSYR